MTAIYRAELFKTDPEQVQKARDFLIERAEELDKARKRIAKLESSLRSAARWIKCHDIYGHMAKDILDEAKALLNDDGEFMFKNGGGNR